MDRQLSLLGFVHTLISLTPVIIAIYSLSKYHFIEVGRKSGIAYLITLLLAVLTSFLVSSTGSLNAGHIFGVVLYMIALFGFFIQRKAWLGRLSDYFATFLLSFSFFLALVPGVNETLTRVPFANPIAKDHESPVILNVVSVLFLVFIVGYIAQVILLKKKLTHIVSK